LLHVLTCTNALSKFTDAVICISNGIPITTCKLQDALQLFRIVYET